MREWLRVVISGLVSILLFAFILIAGFPVVGVYFGMIVLFQLYGYSTAFFVSSLFLFFLADVYQYLPLGRHGIVLYGILVLYLAVASKTRVRVLGFVMMGVVYVLIELVLRSLSADEFARQIILNSVWILLGWIIVRGLNILGGSSKQQGGV